MDVLTGLDLILKAKEENRKEQIFQQWVAQLPWMDKDSFVSFADYYDQVTGANIDRRSVAEIMADVALAEQELMGGGDANGT